MSNRSDVDSQDLRTGSTCAHLLPKENLRWSSSQFFAFMGCCELFVRDFFRTGVSYTAFDTTPKVVLGPGVTFELIYQRLHDARVWGFREIFEPPKKSSWGFCIPGRVGASRGCFASRCAARLAFAPQRWSRGFKPRCAFFKKKRICQRWFLVSTFLEAQALPILPGAVRMRAEWRRMAQMRADSRRVGIESLTAAIESWRAVWSWNSGISRTNSTPTFRVKQFAVGVWSGPCARQTRICAILRHSKNVIQKSAWQNGQRSAFDAKFKTLLVPKIA